MGGKKEKLVGSGSASSLVLAHCQIGIRKSFSFSNLFYNSQTSQTNLNSIQIRILTTSTREIKYKNTSQHKGKYASAWNATIKYLFKYINLQNSIRFEKQGVTPLWKLTWGPDMSGPGLRCLGIGLGQTCSG
jgi:hypothetical protein